MTQQLTSPSPARQAAEPAPGPGWWRDAVIYQVYVRSFADSDGDGVGDLRGVRERLPYLKDLGVDAVWLTPFYASPQADGGYDVADYRTVDPLFGSLEDADALIRAAHAGGLRVIVDIVPNHTSDRHPWFRDPELARERYLFRPGRGTDGELPPNDWESVFGGPAWTRTDRGDWYLHLFAPEQPDLNWDNPDVHAEFAAILRFWLDLGVDGFRIDVAHGMVKAPGLPDIGRGSQATLIGNQSLPFFDQDGVHAIHRSWRTLLESYGGARIGVAEAWAPTPERLALYVRPDELHQAFNFQFLTASWGEAALREVIDASLAATASVGAPTTWVLSNHDVVRHATRLGSLARARAATLLMLALPGSVYLYQGEELGLPEVTDLPDEARQDPAFLRRRSAADAASGSSGQDGLRDGCRVPLPWTPDGASYGFGDGGSWLPQPAVWGGLSVAAQTGDVDSTLELYRAALALRRMLPGLGDGGMTWREAPEGVLAFARPGVVCTVNTTGGDVAFEAPGRLLLASAPLPVRGASAVLPGDSCAWWAI
ncbi:glycoside hydrolase family 13 protein [Streptomyces benahoarensis]|uniref:Glycoside hydrolase family 13 protein n=1 Tax=Streptomyces benahoarensis TaxID=2595054 RepID=A0A553YZZ0_9ACTN|nr:glycoside hydrolase family 13 protein [Streptomyces benahoarensis]TSB19208.1 glycoside hydrolase family 13 protein [Streptomyces benahoarensis]TSB34785.1 glycoside hydrolase family 13 protein [Streptomyces benahoarensis]